MRRLFGCPNIISLTEKFLMARNFFRIFTENNPVMGDSKTLCIPEAKGLNSTCWTLLESERQQMSILPTYMYSVANHMDSQL